MENGGWVVVCSDMFFGHRQNLILPGRSTHMGDGWETRRRRRPGNDWTIVRLGKPGSIRRVEIDTDHFKGNAPGACAMAWCNAPRAGAEALTSSAVKWNELLPKVDLQPHARHRFEGELQKVENATHVRLDIYPDGGVARLRVFGRPGNAP
jgi:allantoicase